MTHPPFIRARLGEPTEYACFNYVDHPFDIGAQRLADALTRRRAELDAQGVPTHAMDEVFPAGVQAGFTRIFHGFSDADLYAHWRSSDDGVLHAVFTVANMARHSSHMSADWQRELTARCFVDGVVSLGRAEATDVAYSMTWMPLVGATPSQLRMLSLRTLLTGWRAPNAGRPDALVEHLDALAEEFPDLRADDPQWQGAPRFALWKRHATLPDTLDDVLAWQTGEPVGDALRTRASYRWLRALWDLELGWIALHLLSFARNKAYRHWASGRIDLCDQRDMPREWNDVPFNAWRTARTRPAQAARRASRPQKPSALPWLDSAGQPLPTAFHQTVPAADHALMLAFQTQHANADDSAAFAGQANGLLGLQVPGLISLVIGAQHAQVDLTVHLCTAEPPLPSAGWTELVEGDWTLPPAHDDTDRAVEGLVLDIDGIDHGSLDLRPGRYRVRLGFAGFDAPAQGEAEPLERCTLALWPRAAEAPAQPDRVLRVQAASARGWHRQEGVSP